MDKILLGPNPMTEKTTSNLGMLKAGGIVFPRNSLKLVAKYQMNSPKILCIYIYKYIQVN